MANLISDEDMLLIRQELEARIAGFKTAWPAPVIIEVIDRIEALLARLPNPDATRNR